MGSRVASLKSGSVPLRQRIQRCRERIVAREGEVRAWQALDWDAVESQVAELERSGPADDRPLWGVPIGVKDFYDTYDFPTGYGTEFYADHRPPWDAAVVANLRRAGAIVLGKTAMTELAYWQPGPTRNPLDLAYSPGGSSSGSAAAVADGMVPAALGSQTAASVIRPAAYCGVVGFKPTIGVVSLAGAKAFAMSLDTAGVLAARVSDVARVAAAMAARQDWLVGDEESRPPRIAVVRAPEWEKVQSSALDAFERTIQRLADAGAEVVRRDAPAPFSSLAQAQQVVMAVEAARDYAFERAVHGAQLSEPLRDLLEQGDRTPLATYEAALRQRDEALASLERLFEGADLLAAPSAPGEAPRFEEGTGDPAMSRAWTLLGLPSITLPAGTGPLGLPLGLQLAARPRHDAALLRAAAWVEAWLAS